MSSEVLPLASQTLGNLNLDTKKETPQEDSTASLKRVQKEKLSNNSNVNSKNKSLDILQSKASLEHPHIL